MCRIVRNIKKFAARFKQIIKGIMMQFLYKLPLKEIRVIQIWDGDGVGVTMILVYA